MILQSLEAYYRRMAQEKPADVAPEGFEKKEIPFLVVVNRRGDFVELQDTREGEGKKKRGRVFTVPKGVKKTSGIAANFFWGTPNYVFGRPKRDSREEAKRMRERANEQHRDFLAKLREPFPDPSMDDGVNAVISFLKRGNFDLVFSHEHWPEIEETAPNLTFRLEEESLLVCQRPAVAAALEVYNLNRSSGVAEQPCLVTGKLDEPVRLHTAIKGVWGAQTSGANIVSFNRDSFRSFGKEQGLNAPVGKRAEFAYTTALNTLLAKGSRQRILVGDATTVFWAERKHPLEDLFADLFGEPAKENPDQLVQAVRTLYNAPASGAPPLDEDYTPFFVLGLAPNAARIAVRFWHAGTVGDTARQVRWHFDDCALVRGPNQPEYLSLFRLLVSTANQGKAENIPPNLGGEFMKAILAGTPYPLTLLSAGVRRCRAEREITYPRAAFIKGVLTREARYYQKTEKEVGMALNTGNTNVGYRLGRLFAVLEKVQEEANPGINATIRDRFYGAASGTPVAAFPHLMKLKNHHLAKLENRGRAVNLEKVIGEIVCGIEDFPAHLSLHDQGRFAVGYYHQRQDFFKKHETTTENL